MELRRLDFDGDKSTMISKLKSERPSIISKDPKYSIILYILKQTKNR